MTTADITSSSVSQSTVTTEGFDKVRDGMVVTCPITLGLGTRSCALPESAPKASMIGITLLRLLIRVFRLRIVKLVRSGSTAKTTPEGPTFLDNQTVCTPMFAPISTTTSERHGESI